MPLYYWSKLILLSGGTDVFPSLLPDPQKISNANILLIHTHTRIWKPAFIYLSVHVAPISRDSIVRCFSSLLISKRFKIICLVIAKDQCVSSCMSSVTECSVRTCSSGSHSSGSDKWKMSFIRPSEFEVCWPFCKFCTILTPHRGWKSLFSHLL